MKKSPFDKNISYVKGNLREYRPTLRTMTQINILKEQVSYLKVLLEELESHNSLNEKLKVLEAEFLIADFFEKDSPLCAYYPNLSLLEKMAFCSIIVIGQAPYVFLAPERFSELESKFIALIKQLVQIDKFYQEIGGIIGYHFQMIQLLFEKNTKSFHKKNFHQAKGLILSERSEEVNQSVLDGILSLPQMGELYPIGGAGDRLDLKDEKTHVALPTAKLMFLGRSLLTGLVRDLQAREYLYYKLFNTQLTTPIAMMTSEAKSNHQFVNKICEKNEWYHRPKSSFFAFMQPLAPVLTEEGNWSLKSPMQLFLKPSGHGVLWKIAQEKGVFNWFYNFGRKKILIRQINNPIAGVDDGLFPLIGIGCTQKKAFGFASCHRLVNSAEGVNILTEIEKDGHYYYGISNIEYTDFEKNGITDKPNKPGGKYSLYPSNTNILFADLKAVSDAVQKCPIPGMLINMKAKVPFLDEKGKLREMNGGRLESTMQNIADELTIPLPSQMNTDHPPPLPTFLTYNERAKTISVTKKTHKKGEPINETPEGCYYTLLANHLELLEKECGFKVPKLCDPETYLEKGPPLHCLYHPALGPLYSIIKQKLRQGKINEGSELQLEITELDIENLNLSGSLRIECTQPLGHLDDDVLLHYSEQAPRCTLKNVSIENQGIDISASNNFWKNQVNRKESFFLQLEENSEFYAEGITFRGNHKIHVPKNTLMIAKEENHELTFECYPISKPSWSWKYLISSDQASISLLKEEN